MGKERVKEFERRVTACACGVTPAGGRPRLLAAVSGGADSVALLRVLAGVMERGRLEVEAVNCNFHLRGVESDRDSLFVSDLCRSLGVKLHSVGFDVESYMASHPGTSVEMACRELRYAEFRRLLREGGFDRIAVAHNSDDNAETLLLNLMRGAGSRGLRGMVADTGEIVRPLLGVSRREIEEYLALLGQTWVTDSSNLSSDYRRNFLRLEVLPLLETRWPSARASLARSASLLAEENSLLEEALDRICPSGSREIPYSAVNGCKAPVTLLRRFIAPFGGTPSQAREMADACGRPGGRWSLTSGHTAAAMSGSFRIEEPADEEERPLTCERVDVTSGLWREIRGTRGAGVLYLPRPLAEYVVRRPAAGDRMRPLGMRGSRLLSDIMKDSGIPVGRRHRLRVVADPATGEVIWLEGLRRSAAHMLPPDASEAWRVC